MVTPSAKRVSIKKPLNIKAKAGQSPRPPVSTGKGKAPTANSSKVQEKPQTSAAAAADKGRAPVPPASSPGLKQRKGPGGKRRAPPAQEPVKKPKQVGERPSTVLIPTPQLRHEMCCRTCSAIPRNDTPSCGSSACCFSSLDTQSTCISYSMLKGDCLGVQLANPSSRKPALVPNTGGPLVQGAAPCMGSVPSYAPTVSLLGSWILHGRLPCSEAMMVHHGVPVV